MNIKILIGLIFDENLSKSVLKNRTFWEVEWGAWILILHQIPQGSWELWAAFRSPAASCTTCDASRRTPLWKFLSTGLVVVPAGCGKSATLYDTEKTQAKSDGDWHSCDTNTEPGATFVW